MSNHRDRTPERKARPSRGWKTRSCGWCGTTWSTRNQSKCCSPVCAANLHRTGASTPIPWAQCGYCGDWFIKPWGERATYCPQHAGHDRRRITASPISYGACDRCSKTFVRRQGQLGSHCSPRCAKATAKRNRKHLERSTAKTGERVTLRRLGDRDGWRCHLCDKPVVKTPGNKPRSPSIDHLVPLSDNGTHTWANVALAHRACNTRRGTGQAQLRLIA